MTGAEFHGAGLFEAELRGANLYRAELHGANLKSALFYGVNLGLADFSDVKNLDEADFSGAWAWSDKLPIGLAGIEIEVCTYDIDVHDFYTKPQTGCVLTVMD